MLIPSAVYVALIDNPWMPLGIYVPSAMFIAAFMRILGKYRWINVVAVSVGTMVAFFLMFEIWFQVPLPKGPLEAALGLQLRRRCKKSIPCSVASRSRCRGST